MKEYLFCSQRLLFFPYAIKERYAKWPESGVDISLEEYISFHDDFRTGMVHGADENGRPVWVEKLATSHDEQCSDARRMRDAEISSSMWIAERHRGQVQLNSETSISTTQYEDLLIYHQSLRDWPAKPGWPDIDMPPEPDWLAEIQK